MALDKLHDLFESRFLHSLKGESWYLSDRILVRIKRDNVDEKL